MLDMSLSVWAQEVRSSFNTTDIPFQSHDGHELFGKLILPKTDGLHVVLIYVQTAEASTVDTKRRMCNKYTVRLRFHRLATL